MGFEPRAVARATGGRLHSRGAAQTAARVVIDSRVTESGDLFVAIEGSCNDGHRFVTEAIDRGAVGVVAKRFDADPRAWWVEVNDTLAGLQSLARARRLDFTGIVTAVTGSNGKTTTKELLRACFEAASDTAAGDTAAGEVVASRASFNNHIGLPLTLLEIGPGTRHVVLEAGSSGRGEIAALAELCRPDLAVVTTVAESHLAGLGDIRGVADEKGDLVRALAAEGIAVLNRDLPFFEFFRSLTQARIVSFGVHPDAAFRILEVRHDSTDLVVRIAERDGGDEAVYETSLAGAHNAPNVAAAVAAARSLGVPARAVREGLRGAVSPPMRMERSRFGSLHLVNDAYNANPGSMRAAIRSFCDLAGPGSRTVAILGDMLELGDRTAELHRGVGTFAARSGLDILVGVGGAMREAIDAARAEGLGVDRARWFEDLDTLLTGLESVVRPDDTVLLKGSRGGALERCVPSMRRIGEDPTQGGIEERRLGGVEYV